MDELLYDAADIKSLHSDFINRIIDDSEETDTEKTDALIDAYLDNFDSTELPEALRQALSDIENLQADTKENGSAAVPPYNPKIDPLSFMPDLAARNLFTIGLRPITNEEGEVIGMAEFWDKPIDATAVANSMKHDAPDTSIIHQMRGNGLEVPLHLGAKVTEELRPTQDDFEEFKFAEMDVLLDLADEGSGRWPKIIEREATANKNAEASRPPPAIVNHGDVFEVMDFLNTAPVPKIFEQNDTSDMLAFVKKKKKTKKVISPDEVIPPEVLEKTKVLEKQEEEKKRLQPMKGDYEFAEMLDVRKNSAEYEKMKSNLARTYAFELDPFQQQAIVAMENGNSVFVAAHTSAGKTVVAEYAIALSRKHRSRVVYTSPIKALSNQKFRDFKNQFDDVGLITGDIQLNSDASCLIMTTEILKSMLYNGRVSADELEWVIFDEVHYINDIERGHVWEEVLIMLPHQVNIVMLSATVPNCMEFADWVGRIKNRKIYVVQTLQRPVPLAHHLYSGKDKKSQNNCFEIMGRNGEFNTNNHKKAKDAQLASWSQKKNGPPQNTNKTYFSKAVDRCHYQTLINFLREKSLLPAVAFIFSRNRCNAYAEMLYQIDLTTNDEKAAIRHLFTKYLDAFKGSDRNLPQVVQMQQLCYRGFAIHHSGILPILKELVEILFQRGFVKFLFATETFAMGVNMPARTVIFDSIEKFDGNCRRPLNCTEYIQMAGRAGRRGIDDTGVVIILSKGSEPYEHAALLPMLKGKAIPLESKFRITYNMLLNIIRAEQLNMEDMLQRSYVERVSLRALASRREKATDIKEKIKALPELKCDDCTEVEPAASIYAFHDVLLDYIDGRGTLITELLTKTTASNHIHSGRYILICYPQKNIACMLACIHSIGGVKDVNVVVLEISKNQPEISEYEKLSEAEKAKIKRDLLFNYYLKHGLETLANVEQETEKLEILKSVPYENIIAICKKKTKFMEEKEINEYCKNKDLPCKKRSASPSRNVSKLIAEMGTFTRGAIQNTETALNLYKIGDDLTSNAVGFHDQLGKYSQLRSKLLDENVFLCRQCVDFEKHLQMVRERKMLDDELKTLQFQTSVGALTLTDNYMNCLDVLKELNFIDKDNIITIKGRVAAQINEDTLLLTELIFENKLQQRGCSEIAAMLCPLTAQHHSAKEKGQERDCVIKTEVANADVINTLKQEMANMANKIDQIERKHGVSDARREEATFGLMEAVYQWAEGMSFEEITHLTDAHEGIVVRCIQRLDEILKDIKNAARIIGDNTIVQKMIDTSAAIRRDIVFAASLYTTDE